MEGFSEYRLSQSGSVSHSLQRHRGSASNRFQSQRRRQGAASSGTTERKKRNRWDTKSDVQVKSKRRQDDEYAWERAYERTWEDVEEDEYGRLRASEFLRKQQQTGSTYGAAARRKKFEQQYGMSHAIRRGMIRFVVIVLDLSQAMSATDFMPSRLEMVLPALKEFLQEFMDQNPLAQLCLITTQNATATSRSMMSSNYKEITKELRKIGKSLETRGEISLKYALDLCHGKLSLMPSYGNKEVIFIQAALSTCDSGDIFDTIQALVKAKTRVSVVSLSGELYISKKITQETHGLFGVAESSEHFRGLLFEHTKPPPKTSREASELVTMVRMGFPRIVRESNIFDEDGNYLKAGFQCPRCRGFTADIPSACSICKLPLVSSAHLARSYHHLFPVAPFVELKSRDDSQGVYVWKNGSSTCAASSLVSQSEHSSGVKENGEKTEHVSLTAAATNKANTESTPLFTSDTHFCAGCLASFQEHESRFVCPESHNTYCSECDIFIHEILHNSPGEV